MGKHWKQYRSALVLGVVLALPGAPVAMACNGQTVTIWGTIGDDVLYGTSGADVMMALKGFDILVGYGGNDSLCGGDHSDDVYGDEDNDYLSGGAGDLDYVDGGAGNDFCTLGETYLNCETCG